ncbi:G-protein coupled receptor Mth2 [Gryllus bimaculatus]|nr:G-protein coupled receptor Mth2 [Gryllus bimaculatus]
MMATSTLVVNFLSLVFVLCLTTATEGRILRKCCPSEQVLNDHGECVTDAVEVKFSTVSPDSEDDYSDIDSSSVHFNESHRLKCDYWDTMVLSWNATDRYSLVENGSLLLYAPSAEGATKHVLFAPEEFCTDVAAHSRSRVIKVCPCKKIICLRKCCPVGHVYNFSSGPRCIKSNDSTWEPHLITSSTANRQLAYSVLEDRMPKCNGFHNFASTAFVPPDLLNGFWWEYPTGKAFQNRQLCKELIYGGKFEMSVICEEVSPWDRVLKPLWHVPAALLLATTLVTLVLCPELRVGTHGRALFCHAAALLVVNVVLAFNAKHTFFGVPHGSYVVLRKGADIIVHYAVWAAALWLNSICINIGLGFRTNGTTRSAETERRNFIWFSLYSWGLPVIITTIVVVLRALPHSSVPFLYKPTMIETRSGHYELEGLLKLTSFAYYFAPMSFLLIVNFAMFIFTSTKVFELRRASRMITKYRTKSMKTEEGEKTRGKKVSRTDAPDMENQNGNSATNTKSMLLYARLLGTMGVLEMVVEIATWATNHYFWYEATMDGVDLLRAACVFSLTCCKRRVLRMLRERLKGCALLRRLRRPSEAIEMDSAHTSSTATRARRSSKSTTASSSEHAEMVRR